MFKKLIYDIMRQEGKKVCFEYWDSRLNIKINEETTVFQNVIDFFSSHFNVHSKWMDEVMAKIQVNTYNYFNKYFKEFFVVDGIEIVIRVSSAKVFNISVLKYEIGEFTAYLYKENHTVLFMNYITKDILLFVDEDSEISVVEFIRDIVIKNQESLGTLILHAAAAEKNGNVVIVSGSKGAGKSTTMMELIFKGGYSMVSGDKLFVKIVDNNVIIKGWPDYPHIGIGTISQYETLRNFVGEEKCKSLSPRDKVLLNPREFYKIDNMKVNKDKLPIGKVIFPDFNVDEEQRIEECTETVEELIRNLEFKNDYPVSKWHNFVIVENDREELKEAFRNAIRECQGFQWKGNINVGKKSNWPWEN